MATRRATKVSEVASIPYECPNCHAQVGEFVPTINGGVALDSNGWLIQDGSKHCHRCGRLIHFKAPRDPWADLVNRYLERLQLAAVRIEP